MRCGLRARRSPAAIALSRLIAALLYGISPTGPATFVTLVPCNRDSQHRSPSGHQA